MSDIYSKRGYLREDFRLFHLRDEGGPAVEYHYHEFYKLVLLISGSGAYIIEGRRYLLQPGDIILVGRGSVHRPEIGEAGAYERVILYLSPALLSGIAADDCRIEEIFSADGGRVIRPEESEQSTAPSLLAEIEAELAGAKPGSEEMSRCILRQLLIRLYRICCSRSAPQLMCAENSDRKVIEVLSYLNDHISDELSIDELAEHFYISKFHMMRRFRAETGSTIHAYITDKRLFLAKDLMRNGMSATEACYQCGFKSYSSFSRAYQKRFGSSPTGREKIQNDAIIE